MVFTFDEYINEKFDYKKQKRINNTISSLDTGDSFYILRIDIIGPSLSKYTVDVYEMKFGTIINSVDNNYFTLISNNKLFNFINSFKISMDFVDMNMAYVCDNDEYMYCLISTNKDVLDDFQNSSYFNEYINIMQDLKNLKKSYNKVKKIIMSYMKNRLK